jgi:hypothetical protein
MATATEQDYLNGEIVSRQRRRDRFKPQRPLETLDVACLIINKMIGAGIFISPPMVTYLVGNKTLALFLWIIGGINSFCRSAKPFLSLRSTLTTVMTMMALTIRAMC